MKPLGMLFISLVVITVHASASEPGDPRVLKQLADAGVHKVSIGVTRAGTPIECLIHDDDLNFEVRRGRVLFVGGLDGSSETVEYVWRLICDRYLDKADADDRKRPLFSAVLCANPDGLAKGIGPNNGVGGDPTGGYPPHATAYNDRKNPEAAYLWRWIGMFAPDFVIEVRKGDAPRLLVPTSDYEALEDLRKAQGKNSSPDEDSLTAQLVKTPACETGTIPAMTFVIRDARAADGAKLTWHFMLGELRTTSPARQRIQDRLARTPLTIANQLSKHYGHDLNQVVYIPALSLIGRVRLGQLLDDDAHLRDVERIAAPYFTAEKESTPKSGSGLSGHLVFCELAERTTGKKQQRYIELARAAADLAFDDETGKLKPSMPFHSEMSDAVFMGGPILARVGKLTGDRRYFDACAQHVAFMQKLVLREDGLYRHSPLDEAAWGRGNGFPALGLAMCLTHFPNDHPARKKLLDDFRSHMNSLAAHQDPTGCWHQVIDRPESYRELTATCMITFAMARGVRHGWLDAQKFAPLIDQGWYAIKTRVAPNGRLVDVCTGTGKQKNLRAYYDRTAILGKDARGGAMALMAATEMAVYIDWKNDNP